MIYNNSRVYRILKFIKWGLVYPVLRKWMNQNNLLTIKFKNEYGGELAIYDKLNKFKKSNTLFVFGSGQSINNLNENQLKEIEKYDSIGINGFLRHKFKPTFLSFEWITCPKNQEEISGNQETFRILLEQEKEFDSTCIILRPSPVVYPHNFNEIDQELRILTKSFRHIYWNLFDNIVGDKINDFSRYLNWYHKIGLTKRKDFFINKDSSLSWSLGFAYKLGYEKIVLCGIDLYGFHFYDNPNKLTLDQFHNANNKLHLTNDPDYVGITVIDIIDFWKKRFGSNLFIGSEFSLLHNKLPPFKY